MQDTIFGFLLLTLLPIYSMAIATPHPRHLLSGDTRMTTRSLLQQVPSSGDNVPGGRNSCVLTDDSSISCFPSEPQYYFGACCTSTTSSGTCTFTGCTVKTSTTDYTDLLPKCQPGDQCPGSQSSEETWGACCYIANSG